MPIARHALCTVVRVSADERPPLQQLVETVYAVFTPDNGPAGAGRFLGLVTSSQTGSYHEHTFADLLPHPAPAAVSAQTLLKDVVTHLDQWEADVVAVLEEGGAFFGAITRASLLEALLRGEPKPDIAITPVETSLHLASLLALHREEQDLLQPAIETLTALLKARYGAIGVVDEHGQLLRFIHTGIPPELAARIGDLPSGRGLLGIVIAENHALRLDDMSRDPRSVGFPPHHPPMKNLLVVPISRDSRVYGRMYFSDRLDGTPFSEEDKRLATQSADILGLALSHHRLQNERHQSADALHVINQVLSDSSGESLLHKLVLSIAKALGVDYAFIGELAPGQQESVQTVAFCAKGQFADNFIYELKSTPCSNVIGKAPCSYPDNIQRKFPDDHMLRDMGVESYVGVPLFGSNGVPLGLLVVMDGKAMRNPQIMESVLQICAMRAAAELERRHAETELHKLSSAIEQTADSVIITGPDGVIEYVNQSFEKTTGYGRDEAVGRKPNLIKSDQHDEGFYRHLWETIRRGETFRGTFINRRKDGSLYHEEMTITPLKDGKGRTMHFVATGKDISERMHSEQEARDTLHFLDSVVENLPSMLFVKDA